MENPESVTSQAISLISFGLLILGIIFVSIVYKSRQPVPMLDYLIKIDNIDGVKVEIK